MKPPIPFYQSSIDACRLFLMLCVCLNLFGFPTAGGAYVQLCLNFAPCAFFILSGYLVLRHAEDRGSRIGRTILRSGVTFAALFVGYLALNLIFERESTLTALTSLRFWFDFLVFNNWSLPIGRPIWFVQAIFYAYILLYFLHRWKLLRFDWLFAALFLVIGLLTGELSSLIHFHFLGETFIPGNFFTRALPYLLIGHLLRRIMPLVVRISYYAWWLAAGGVVILLGEAFLLHYLNAFTYYGHLLGMGIIAIALCCRVITGESNEVPSFAAFSFRRNATLILYYLCSPVCYFLIRILSGFGEETSGLVAPYMGILVIMVCLSIALVHEILLFLISVIGFETSRRKRNSGREDPDSGKNR